MAAALSQVTVTSTATLLFTAAGATVVYLRQPNPRGPGVVRVGDASVTVGNGLPILTLNAGIALPTGASLYGITEPGTTTIVNVLAIA